MDVVRYDAGTWGHGTLWLEGEVAVWHELPVSRARPPEGGARAPAVTLSGDALRVCDGTAPLLRQRLTEYFRGARVDFADVAIDLEWCTPFQRAVAETLRAVPYGEVVTYGELAALSGHPNAQRAAGTFCAANRLPLLMPCHRVVAVGGIGSYGSLGSEYKRRLLELEGVVV